MKLSVIIPCLNAEDTIEAQLKALAKQEFSERWEVIISDNGCTDTTIDRVLRYQGILPNLQILDASKRRGPSFAINQGAHVAQGESLVFCDADDEVGRGWLGAMARALQEHDFVTGARDYSKLNPLYVYNNITSKLTNQLGKFGFPPYFPFTGRGTMGIKKNVFLKLGGFDEDKFLYCEDLDFCAKAYMANIPIYFESDAINYIRHRHSLRDVYSQRRNWGEYSILTAKTYEVSKKSPSKFLKSFLKRWIKTLLLMPMTLTKSGRWYWIPKWGNLIGTTRGILKFGWPSV